MTMPNIATFNTLLPLLIGERSAQLIDLIGEARCYLRAKALRDGRKQLRTTKCYG